jgi:hypothetical protein
MLVTALWFFHVGRRFAEDRHFGITSGENVSHLSESVPAPAVPQWKFIHVLSAKNDSSVLSLSDDACPRLHLFRIAVQHNVERRFRG